MSGSTTILIGSSILDIPGFGKIALDVVLESLENANIEESDFRKFLSALEITSFENHASKICKELFQFVQRNLNPPSSEEVNALGCAIRKLVFNFTDNELPQIETLLEEVKCFRIDGNVTDVEKMLCKELVERFEVYPIPPNRDCAPLAACFLETVNELAPKITSKNNATKSVLMDAILGALCYSENPEQIAQSINYPIPNSIIKLLHSIGNDIQKSIDSKIVDVSKRPNILPVLQKYFVPK